MYCESAHTEDNQIPYVTMPIRVFLINSNIYSNDLSATNTEENAKQFVLPLSIYNQMYVSLNEIMIKLAEKSNINFTDQQIFFKLTGHEVFRLAGIYPFKDVYLSLPTLAEPIIIKFRVSWKIDYKKKKKERRGNERIISDVINGLILWQTLSILGQIGPSNEIIRYTRVEAAKVVGIPEKTLEDYLLQVRTAFWYGFDFNMYCHSRFGVIREFNRQNSLKVYA